MLGDELQATPEGQAILEAWNELTIYYGVASVSEMVIRNALNKLKHNVDVVVNRGRFVDDTGSTTRTLNGEEKTKLVKLYEDFELKTGFKAVGSAEAGIDGISANLRRYLDELPEAEANLFWDEVYDTDIWENLIKNSDDQVSLVDAWKVLDDTGIEGIADKIEDVKFVDDYLKKNPGKTVAGVTDEIKKAGGYGKWVDDISSEGQKYWRTALEMREDVTTWAKAYRGTLPSTRQMEKFNKACAASYKKADGTIETVFGRNGGVLNTQATYPTMSAEKGLGLHPELAKRLPEKAMWPNTANCAECDAVNQALHNGAKWEDIQIHTIDIRPDGTITDVIQCSDCQNIFKNMYVTSQ